MQDSNLGYQKWAVTIHMLNSRPKGVSSVHLAKDLGISQSSAWHLGHRIREAWSDLKLKMMEGPVEADETYGGGKSKNREAHKRYYRRRGTVGKTPLVGVVDRATNTVRTMKSTTR